MSLTDSPEIKHKTQFDGIMTCLRSNLQDQPLAVLPRHLGEVEVGHVGQHPGKAGPVWLRVQQGEEHSSLEQLGLLEN